MKLLFRPAKSGDVLVVLGFMRELYAHDHLPFDEHGARTALETLIRDPSLGCIWLIHDGGVAIGYVVLTLGYSLEYQGRDAFVDELFVRESHRGYGVGRQTLAFVEGACRSLEVRALHLEVERENADAHEFYRKMGFKDHDRYLLTKWM